MLKPSLRTFLRAFVPSFAFFILFALAPREAAAQSPCGGVDQRACCLGERNGPACDGDLVERAPCVGDCRCARSIFSSSGTCRRDNITACGGPGQRACCAGERAEGACNSGFHEEGGCTGNCRCRNSLASSIGTCRPDVVITPCGGPGQRACCAGERAEGTCNAGLHEEGRCTGNCRCARSPVGASSIGVCRPDVVITPCGGPGQRACCAGERTGGACDLGLEEKAGCTGNCRCARSPIGASSIGTCAAEIRTPCGGVGQRACCIGERAQGACDGGLTETSGCVGDCRCARSPIGASSIGTCRRITACGKEGERACCLAERATPCDPGTVEAVSAQLFSSNLSCDLRGREELIKSGNAWQCDCAAGGISLGVCLRTRFDPTATCWFQTPAPKPTAAKSKPAMSLYVAGMNHARADGRTSAHREGAAELAKAVGDSAEDPRSIVVAFSESIRDDLLSGAITSCEAGDKIGADGIPHNGECVAYALEQRFRRTTRFTYKSWQWWGETGGPALITGSRWKVVSTANLEGNPGRAFEVRLQDTRNPRTHVSLYMFHTSGDDGATPKAWQETVGIVKLARQRMRRGDLTPLFVGDFNTGIGAPSGGIFSGALAWWNLGNFCPIQPGVAQPLQFSLEQQILHIFAGKRSSSPDDLDFSCSSGHLAPVNLKYSRMKSGEPTSRNDGIWLPNVAHNVVAMGFEIKNETPARCQAPGHR
jgi:hypothetical protein